MTFLSISLFIILLTKAQTQIIIVLLVGVWHGSNIRDIFNAYKDEEYLTCVLQLFSECMSIYVTYLAFLLPMEQQLPK